MPNKQNFIPYFATFFGLSLILILFGTSGIYNDISSIFNRASEPGKSLTNILTLKSLQNNYINKTMEENLKLKKALSDQKNILTENMALKSQFESSSSESQNFLPAKVIGSPGFMPGINNPEYLIINQGEKDGVKNGDAVLSNNFLIGKVLKIYPDFSKVELLTNKNSSFVVKIQLSEESNGILKGKGGDELSLENVLLTTKLEKDAPILTKGDKNEKGEGYPPDLNIGKIQTIEKKQSDLFQRAIVVSPIDFKNLNTVFVLTN